ncbi:MAG TPA: transporter [Vicinamibacterales bacterium]|nr:transporter [Vicinamibacterales bacterium]
MAIGCALPARAQPPVAAPTERQPLEPDRPDVTNGTHIVDVGLLQMEVGVQRLRLGGGAASFGTPTTFRVGLTDWIEVRFGTDGYVSSTDPIAGTNSGIGNVQLGAKIRFWADPGGIPVLSILPGINLPTASAAKGLGSGQSDLTVALLTGTDFLTRGHVDVNYGFGMIGSGPGLSRFSQHLVSASASVEIPGPVTPYLEYFWISRQDPRGGHVAAMDAGAIYVITPRFALDGGAQWGVSDAAPASVFAGVSVIVGNILGDHGVHARQRQAMKRSLGHPHK